MSALFTIRELSRIRRQVMNTEEAAAAVLRIEQMQVAIRRTVEEHENPRMMCDPGICHLDELLGG